MSNCDNPKIGREFQNLVCEILAKYYQKCFTTERSIPIGKPPKEHRFDCVSDDRTIVVECKCYTWTATGNIPSAKLMGLNEAVFYLNYLPTETKKIIAMKKSTYPGKTETLAEYYNRIDGHLLEGIEIIEIDDNGYINWIRRNQE